MDDKADRDALISQFCSITSADVERAQLYLESTGWNIDLATRSFFEQQEEDIEQVPPFTPSVENFRVPESEEEIRMSSDQKGKKKSDSRFATLNSLRTEGNSSDEDGQAYYAGGSEHSGQQMLGPPKKKDPNEVIQSLFKSAKEHGAQVVDKNEKPEMSTPSFSGKGHKLGSENEQPTPVIPAFAAPQSVHLNLKMWRNGFSIDDGPLRAYSSPESSEFLRSIERGEIPQELVRSANGAEVNLNMEDHRHEEYVSPKKSVQAFGGKGNRLGSATPTFVQESSSAPPPQNVVGELKIDESQPTTNVQIRLADGSKIVMKLNLSNSIEDIRRHICSLRPQYATQPFVLMTTFPKMELNNEKLTIEEAKLQNAVIVQTFK